MGSGWESVVRKDGQFPEGQTNVIVFADFRESLTCPSIERVLVNVPEEAKRGRRRHASGAAGNYQIPIITKLIPKK